MFSVIFSCRMDLNPENPPLERLLSSFEHHTSKFEKSISEFIIKFDLDDTHLPDDSFFNKFSFNIKPVIWDRHAGRGSLHTVQNTLLNFVRHDCKFLQVIADDFRFTRSGFISEMIPYQDHYIIFGDRAMKNDWAADGAGGYAPCFTKKIIDATCGFGPHCNSDGFAFAIKAALEKQYNYNPAVDFPVYYERMFDTVASTQKVNCPYIKACHYGHEMGFGPVMDNCARNIFANMKLEGKI